MPQTEVIFYCETDGTAPVKVWLEGLNKKVVPKCVSYIRRLNDFGHMLRRPTADYLRDDIHELRATYMNVHYRILYFFYGRGLAVLAHGCFKEGRVGESDIDRAVERKRKFQANPERHTYTEED